MILRKYMNQGKTILVGDAPGIDRQVQDFLKENNYKDVEVYSPGKEVRYNANPEWKTNLIDVPEASQGSSEWLAGKDKAMSDRADEGLAIVLDDGSQATRNNISRLNEQDKNCDVFQLNKDGKDGWTKHGDFDENTLKKLKSEGYARDSYENESETDNGYLDKDVSHYGGVILVEVPYDGGATIYMAWVHNSAFGINGVERSEIANLKLANSKDGFDEINGGEKALTTNLVGIKKMVKQVEDNDITTISSPKEKGGTGATYKNIRCIKDKVN